MSRRFYFILVLICAGFELAAQVEREEPSVTSPGLEIATRKIYGKVSDKNTGKALQAATVQLYGWQAGSESLLLGNFSKGNGDFSFNELPVADSFRVVVSGVGYKEWQTIVSPEPGKSFNIDLGNILIETESKVMSNIIITSQRPALQMGIDRKVFNVDRNLTATGGTALEVMRNIPSVSVDVEGNVLLRNAQPQIFVDGRPTILTPDQIPADQVERIELITNPSARFDASSSAGIINIVMKRNRRIGINGVASAGVGHPKVLNSNLTLNLRQGKFNFFTSGTYNQSGGLAKGRTFRENRQNKIAEDFFNQYTNNENIRRFGSLRLGMDFFATNRSTFSITQNLVKGRSRNEEEQDQEYLDKDRILERTGKRTAVGINSFNRYNTQLNFTHKFPEQGKEFNANVNYNYGDSKSEADIINSFFNTNGSPFQPTAQVRNAGSNDNDQISLQADFTDPIGKDGKLEAGIRSYINKQESLFSTFSIDNGQETLLPLGNNYAYKETVNAAYVSFSNKIADFSYQAGLRAEVSSFEGKLIDSGKSFGYNYPGSASRFFDALFPSVFLTKKFGESTEVQFNYSRRIRRPNFWQLNPFIDIADPVNLRQGNPQLLPEFVNSFEFNLSQDYKGGNFLGVVYYRNNMRDITRYSDTISTALYQQLNNAAIDPNAILNTFINARSTNTLGLELTLQQQFSKNFEIIPTIDMQYRKVNADVDALRLSNSGFNWDAELTVNYKFAKERGLLKDLSTQLSGEYESKEVTAQGRNAPEYQVDFGLRKEFGKEKRANISFNINDIFNTHRFGNFFDTDNFYQESYRRRNVRSFRITFTYKFGKDDFKLFRREGNNRGDDDEG